jgi:hypothetical protein
MDQHVQFLENRRLMSIGMPTATVAAEPALAEVAVLRSATTPVGTYAGKGTSLTRPGGWCKLRIVVTSWKKSTGAMRGTVRINHMTNPDLGRVDTFRFATALKGADRSFSFKVDGSTVKGNMGPKYASLAGKTSGPEEKTTFSLTRK